MAGGAGRTLGEDGRDVAWWVLAGAAAGAISGLVVGGVGGRLAMLLLRLTSPDHVIGVTSDDGFEIGVITTDTFSLVLAMAVVGGVNGVLYAVLRGAIPRRLRLPLWTLFAAAVGGANFVHSDGIDFTVLEPVGLSIALFVVLPGAAAALVVVLTERWADRRPFADRRLTAVLVVAALAGTLACLPAAGAWLLAVAVRRVGAARLLARVGTVVVPAVLALGTVRYAVELVRTTRILV